MPHFRVVLVEPLNDGNVGAIARSMKNFGLDDLVLVRPCALGEEAVKRSMHGIDVLRAARTVYKEEEALEGAGYVVGTSGIDTLNEKKFGRLSMTPRELVERLKGFDGEAVIVFGREDFGLHKDMIKRCDFLVTIPANPAYPILNISHAASIVFYELFAASFRKAETRKATELEMEKMMEYFTVLLDVIDYPGHKREKTKVMFRRMMSRAVPTTWEFHTLMGVLDGAIKTGSDGKLPKKKR
ncbi:MAG TPA: RNA methyltransferase [Thermoplasmata archaeon]|nr:RNA methyltransferase [Thermoplasmata archaeon]